MTAMTDRPSATAKRSPPPEPDADESPQPDHGTQPADAVIPAWEVAAAQLPGRGQADGDGGLTKADLSAIPEDLQSVAVRMIHACGMVDLVNDLAFSAEVGRVARAALQAGAPILADAMMVAHGVTRSRLPADNTVLCTLDTPDLAELARRGGSTRSAAAR